MDPPHVFGQTSMFESGDSGIFYKIITGDGSKENESKKTRIGINSKLQIGYRHKTANFYGHMNAATDIKFKYFLEKWHKRKSNPSYKISGFFP